MRLSGTLPGQGGPSTAPADDRATFAAAGKSNNGDAETASAPIHIQDLNKTYRTRRGETHALKGISLDVIAGEVMVLLGPSGCGKTTLLRCIAGLEHPDSGEIEVHGRPVYSSTRRVLLPPEQRNLSMVFQSYALWPHMSVLDNVGYPLTTTKAKKGEIRERAVAALELVGLGHLTGSFPGQLSGGQQQRVALARALVGSKGVILFDEPLSNLDAKVRERLRSELFALQAEIGFTAIYVTHDQTEAASLGHRITVMEVGKVAQVGTPTQIMNEPVNAYVADFVGSSNVLHGTVRRTEGAGVLVETRAATLLCTDAQGTLRAGGRTRIMFRPEHCHLTHDTDSANVVTGLVQQSAYLGSYFEHQVSSGDDALLVRTMKGELLPVASTAALLIEPQYLRAYPSD